MTPSVEQAFNKFRAQKYFASLDGLRALSILAVIWYHVPELRPLWRTGYLGVHLFFVISGFLITTLLLREKAETGRISLRNFYIRRTLRIFPAYYLTLLLFLVACLLIPELRGGALPTYLRNLPSFATYTSNWFVEPWGSTRVVFVAAWSLATEEQFYLFWPAILAFSSRWYVPAGIMVALIAASTTIKLVYGYQFFLHGPALPIVMLNSISVAICLGCLLAITLQREAGFRRVYSILGARWSSAVFFATMLYFSAVPNSDTLDVAHMSCVTVAMMLALGAVVVREDHMLRSVLTNKVAVYLGMVSYGLYLYHAFGINLADRYLSWLKPIPPAYFLAVVLSTLALASISFYLYERPFLKLKKRFERRRATSSQSATRPAPTLVAAESQ